jgi:hypothetical protein
MLGLDCIVVMLFNVGRHMNMHYVAVEIDFMLQFEQRPVRLLSAPDN